MNYRHIYHAGNFADVLKHIVLVLCLDYLQRKDGGLCLIDAHGGAGLYALNSEEAAKTGEWERGIGRLPGRDGRAGGPQALSRSHQAGPRCAALSRLAAYPGAACAAKTG